MTPSGKQFDIASGDHEATIVEVGAGLRHYRRAGADVTVGYDADSLTPKCCGTALVPWPNRLRGGRYTFAGVEEQLALTEPKLGNASHGLGRWARWDLVAHDADRVTLALEIVPQPGYPFEVRVEVCYALDADTGLTVSASATNHGAGPAPFGAGFHPYLSAGGAPLAETRVQIPGATRLLFDDAQIPVGSEPVDSTPYDLRDGATLGSLRLDAGFTALSYADGRGEAHVSSAAGGATIWFTDAFKFLQVFTLDDLAGAGPGVAVEPMTCAPDAFNSGSGLLTLEPGQTWTGSWGIVAR